MKQPHILCDKNDVAQGVLLPGDPARVDRVAKFLDNVKEIAYNREFKTITGEYKGAAVTVTSTGIGGASAVIAMEELISCGAKAFIRIGSAGASQKGIALGDLVLPTGVVRHDGASRMYVEESFPAVADHQLLGLMKKACEERSYPHHLGITRSHDSFYIDNEQETLEYWSSKGVLGSDMEAATVLTLASLRGVRAAAVLNNVVLFGEDVKEGIGEYVDETAATAEGERREIEIALEALAALEL